MKRVVDLVCAGLGVVFLSPLFCVLAVMIKVDSPGPALFRQVRVGRYGREFQILKFRTMRVDAGGPMLTSGQDTRVTRVGRWLRSSKLDELAQLLNVLRGEMSMVGPRPEVPSYVAHWPEDMKRVILSVRPGITDPASVQFRRESEMLARVSDPESHYLEVIMPQKLDAYAQYVGSRSTMGDVGILIRTVRATLGG